MGLFFWFKRVVGMAAQPLPVTFLFLAIGITLALFTRRKKNAVASVILAGAVLFATTFPPLVRLQAGLLERRHAPLLRLPPGRENPVAVVVFGNGVTHPGDRNLPALTRLNDCARARLVEGVRVWRMTPESMLVTSGYGMGLENCADAMAMAAEELGVPAEKLRRLTDSLTTEHEARLVAGLAEGGDVVVVTSAAHMPRTMMYCDRYGVRAIPAPCDFIVPVSADVRGVVDRHRWRPRGGSLADSEAIWHEALGLLYGWLGKSL